ncbi:uncharacterized protein V6R79_008421 [Siganus canaliculatus]
MLLEPMSSLNSQVNLTKVSVFLNGHAVQSKRFCVKCYSLYYVLMAVVVWVTVPSRPDLPSALVDAEAVRDGGAVTARSSKCQTTMLDQRLNQNSETDCETKERMKEPSPEKEEPMRPDTDKEQLIAILPEETKDQTVSNMSDIQRAVKDALSVRVGDLKQDCGGITVHQMKSGPEEGHFFPSPDTSPLQEFSALLKCQQTEDVSQATTNPEQKKMDKTREEQSVTATELNVQSATTPEQKQIPSVKELMSPAKCTSEVAECWDEYMGPAADGIPGDKNSEVLLASLLSDNQTHVKLSGKRSVQSGWHFPVGPGLTGEVQCSSWQFPTISYYPPMESTVPFHVMWRVWEESDESASADYSSLVPFPFTKASMSFTVMSYNILAQDLLEANQGLYEHCPLEVLDWSYRCSLILEEIQKWAPDILCLQEVQENHYHEQLYPVLSQMGYSCIYKRRTGEKTDGCATCYRSSCFSEISVVPLEFFRPETELLDRHNVGIILLLRPVITQGEVVEAIGQTLCVANTHLLFNPRRGDVKLAQLAIILAEIDRVYQSCKDKGEHCNLILCGDFNSVPHMPLYQLITTGELFFQGLPAWMISGQENLSYKTHCHRLFAPLWPSCLGISDRCQYTNVNETFKDQSYKPGKGQYSHEFLQQLRFCPAACVRPQDLMLIPGVTDNTPGSSWIYKAHSTTYAWPISIFYIVLFRNIISHRLDLKSVYNHILPGSGSPEVTTLHSDVGATVDYIFYNPRRQLTAHAKAGSDFVTEGLKLIGSLSLLSEDLLWSMRGLPNDTFPSDHLSLLAKFQMDLITT